MNKLSTQLNESNDKRNGKIFLSKKTTVQLCMCVRLLSKSVFLYRKCIRFQNVAELKWQKKDTIHRPQKRNVKVNTQRIAISYQVHFIYSPLHMHDIFHFYESAPRKFIEFTLQIQSTNDYLI